MYFHTPNCPNLTNQSGKMIMFVRSISPTLTHKCNSNVNINISMCSLYTALHTSTNFVMNARNSTPMYVSLKALPPKAR